ncbi:hypothetical protein [Bradyrhizobium sp. B120]|uniref:hypothetical protein n=1 Tax=Bradyrhizobium sp. B120 TaxID=3410088 RepID=UPI003B97EB33
MISSLSIFILTAAELAARPAAEQPAVPIDCRNTDPRAGQRLNLICFSRSGPDPRGLPCQNSASHQLRGRRQSSLAATHWQLSP